MTKLSRSLGNEYQMKTAVKNYTPIPTITGAFINREGDKFITIDHFDLGRNLYKWTVHPISITGSYSHGYKLITIFGRKYYLHRLMAETFVPNPKNLKIAHHKDGNHRNNSADNLEWR